MSERILKALLQLFAIIARFDDEQTGDLVGRQIVESFLRERLPKKFVSSHLEMFDEYTETYQKISTRKNGERKRNSVNSVKVLRICTQINEELRRLDQIKGKSEIKSATCRITAGQQGFIPLIQ